MRRGVRDVKLPRVHRVNGGAQKYHRVTRAKLPTGIPEHHQPLSILASDLPFTLLTPSLLPYPPPVGHVLRLRRLPLQRDDSRLRLPSGDPSAHRRDPREGRRAPMR
jgi:hypothetical protein